MGDLAQAGHVSLRSITAYLNRQKTPSFEVVERFAAALHFPTAFFYRNTPEEPPSEGTSFRALTSMTAKLQNQALAAGALAIELSDWIEARFRLPAPNVPRLDDVDPETAAAMVRAEWGLGERPIRNVIHRLEANGIRIFSLAEETRSVDAFSFWRGDRPFIFLNTMKSAERSRTDAAHELGHLVLHWRSSARGKAAEEEAKAFGSAFLMPRGSVIASVPKGAHLSQIIAAKRRWGVAAAALTYRLHKLRMLTDWQYRRLFTEISRSGFRTVEPETGERETSQALAKVFAALKEEGKTTADVASELDLYVDELNCLLFGLTRPPLALTPSSGAAKDPAPKAGPSRPPQLRLVF